MPLSFLFARIRVGDHIPPDDRGRDKAHTQRSAYTSMDPGTRMRLHPGCRDRQRGRRIYVVFLPDLSASTEEEAEEDDMDLESCLGYKCEHDLDD